MGTVCVCGVYVLSMIVKAWKGCRKVHPPTTQVWGVRRLVFRDERLCSKQRQAMWRR